MTGATFMDVFYALIPLLIVAVIVLLPAFATVLILIVRRPDHDQPQRPKPERRGFAVEPLNDGEANEHQ